MDIWRSAAPGSWTHAAPSSLSLYFIIPLSMHTLRSGSERVRVRRLLGEFRRGARCYRDVRRRHEIWHKVFGTCSRETFEYKFNGWGVENVLHAAASPTFHIQITQDCENNKNRDEQFLSADVRHRIQKPEAESARPLQAPPQQPRRAECGCEIRETANQAAGGPPPRVIGAADGN